MSDLELLHTMLKKSCPNIHKTRLASLLDVVDGALNCGRVTQVEIARALCSHSRIKHKIKKVNRLHKNRHLSLELPIIYGALSQYLFSFMNQNASIPIIIDLCFMQDDRQIQMLSAEIANRGRSIPLYREVLQEGQLRKHAKHFIDTLNKIIPKHLKVIIVMDAGFYENWFCAIESAGWDWICRIRQGRQLYDCNSKAWKNYRHYVDISTGRVKAHGKALLTKAHKHACDLVSIKKKIKGRHYKTRRGRATECIASKAYSRSAKEPWLLAHSMGKDICAKQVIQWYAKRMQIEESFRDLKNHRSGLGARSMKRTTIQAWNVAMLISTIIQIIYWMIGAVARDKGFQAMFQSNTSHGKRVFSDFYLGRLVVKHCWGKEAKVRKNDLRKLMQAVYYAY